MTRRRTVWFIVSFFVAAEFGNQLKQYMAEFQKILGYG